MRRWLAGAVLVVALAGCTDQEPANLPTAGRVVTGTASAPAGPTSAGPSSTVPTATSTPRSQFQALVGQWQAARSAFLSLVTGGRPLSLDAEHTAAQVFLAAERRFAAALDPARWPAPAGGALRSLRQASAQMQSHLVAMERADSPATFTERLADYSVDVARDNAAIRAVDQILAR
jgi:hypothetical protein